MARSYFANAVKLSNQTNIRALYGLMLTANSLAANPKLPPKAKQDNTRYAAWAKAKIEAKHKQVRMFFRGSFLENKILSSRG
jgi:hypothetical protein